MALLDTPTENPIYYQITMPVVEEEDLASAWFILTFKVVSQPDVPVALDIALNPLLQQKATAPMYAFEFEFTENVCNVLFTTVEQYVLMGIIKIIDNLDGRGQFDNLNKNFFFQLELLKGAVKQRVMGMFPLQTVTLPVPPSNLTPTSALDTPTNQKPEEVPATAQETAAVQAERAKESALKLSIAQIEADAKTKVMQLWDAQLATVAADAAAKDALAKQATEQLLAAKQANKKLQKVQALAAQAASEAQTAKKNLDLAQIEANTAQEKQVATEQALKASTHVEKTAMDTPQPVAEKTAGNTEKTTTEPEKADAKPTEPKQERS